MGRLSFLKSPRWFTLTAILLTWVPDWVEAVMWQIETVDSIGFTGSYSSLALDGSGNPHISYRQGPLLKYARWSGGWTIETVDSSTFEAVNTSIAVDVSGNPSISYSELSFALGFIVKVARRSGIWDIDTVDSGIDPSIAIDGMGNQHIAYDGLGILKYARWNGLMWEIQVVDTTGGSEVSIALDGFGNPHISYWGSGGDLQYARWNGLTWEVEDIDTTGVVGLYTSLALDGSGYPHISYQDNTNRNLKVAQWNGFIWDIEAVDTTGIIAQGTSIAIKNSVNPQIVYEDNTNWDLKYALWDGMMWKIERVDTVGHVGEDHSITLDDSGNPHISYSDLNTYDLKYAKGTLFHDGKTLSILAPPDTVFTDSSHIPEAWVYNRGEVLETFDVIATIAGYSDTQTVVSLPSGDSTIVTFSLWIVPSTDSVTYPMTVCTEVSQDSDSSNDCTQKSIFAYTSVGIVEDGNFDPELDSGAKFALFQNTPNPFHHSTVIRYQLPHSTHVTLKVYDLTGKLVRVLVDEKGDAGNYIVEWNGRDSKGEWVTSGIYFTQFGAFDYISTKKTVLLR